MGNVLIVFECCAAERTTLPLTPSRKRDGEQVCGGIENCVLKKGRLKTWVSDGLSIQTTN